MVDIVTVLVALSAVFSVFILYILNRERSIRYMFELGAALALAYIFYLIGYSETLAFLGLGMTLSLAFYMKK